MREDNRLICWLDDAYAENADQLGGKNSSLARMIRNLKSEGIQVPQGFATTSFAYKSFIEENELEVKIKDALNELDMHGKNLARVGMKIRKMILAGELSSELSGELVEYFHSLKYRSGRNDFSVAVRSSATAEDLPGASFAGQLETYLNVESPENLLSSVKECFASLFTDRAIAYRIENGFDHMKVALSVGIQEMIRSDRASSGVMFTIDMETGFPDVVVINGSWGLGEYVVQGSVNPDEYMVFKPLLREEGLFPIIEKKKGSKKKKLVYGRKNQTRDQKTSGEEQHSYVLDDEEILMLSRWAMTIEQLYERPMDMEWAKDGETGELYIVQARPETVQSQQINRPFKLYSLLEDGEELVSGTAIGEAIATGEVIVLESMAQAAKFKDNAILVAKMTDPDWVPLMRRASAIVTELGGRTSHAAIVSRELGVPAVIGASNAVEILKDIKDITVSCAEGDKGRVFKGSLEFQTAELHPEDLPQIRTQIMLNIATPGSAFRWWRLPVKGVGLARLEFLISNVIQIHPMALLHPEMVEDQNILRIIEQLVRDYETPEHYFIEKLAQGIGMIAASQYPYPVIVRLSDFKTNEYAKLIGGEYFEPEEENPMLGFRGASRYYHESYIEGFIMECQALKYVREVMGFTNVIVMVPFCRTLKEADEVLHVMSEQGLVRGEGGLKIYMMTEIPANVILASEFAQRFDGFSIGSNDLTQLILGVDRDSHLLEHIFDESNSAVKEAIRSVIEKAHHSGVKVGICGQAPSDDPSFAEFLVDAGIDSISLNPDSVIKVISRIAHFEEHGRSRFRSVKQEMNRQNMSEV